MSSKILIHSHSKQLIWRVSTTEAYLPHPSKTMTFLILWRLSSRFCKKIMHRWPVPEAVCTVVLLRHGHYNSERYVFGNDLSAEQTSYAPHPPPSQTYTPEMFLSGALRDSHAGEPASSGRSSREIRATGRASPSGMRQGNRKRPRVPSACGQVAASS